MFYDILERKNAFPSDKNKKFKKWKKPVSPWFWSKIGHFIRCFYFGQYRPGNCVLGYSILNQNKKIEKWAILDHNHGLTPLEKY